MDWLQERLWSWGAALGPLLCLFLLPPWVATHFCRGTDPVECGLGLWSIRIRVRSALPRGGGQGRTRRYTGFPSKNAQSGFGVESGLHRLKTMIGYCYCLIFIKCL